MKQDLRQGPKTCGLAWNEKNLDYEIETRTLLTDGNVALVAWNEKNLDYEIETELDTRGW